MADWAEKIQKQAGPQLFPGEQVVAGVLVKPKLMLDDAPYWIPRHGVFAILAARFIQSRSTPVDPMTSTATDFPTSQSVLGLSAHRLMAFSHGSIRGRAKKLVAAVSIGGIDVMSMTRNDNSVSRTGNDSGSTLLISFRDGSSKSYEVVNSAKLSRFVAEFEALNTGSHST